MSEDQSARVARDAAIQSLISNLVYMGIIVAASMAVSNRDWLRLQGRRVRAVMRRDARRDREERQVAELRRDISRFEHGGAA